MFSAVVRRAEFLRSEMLIAIKATPSAISRTTQRQHHSPVMEFNVARCACEKSVIFSDCPLL